jgi:hypothetical protein
MRYVLHSEWQSYPLSAESGSIAKIKKIEPLYRPRGMRPLVERALNSSS